MSLKTALLTGLTALVAACAPVQKVEERTERNAVESFLYDKSPMSREEARKHVVTLVNPQEGTRFVGYHLGGGKILTVDHGMEGDCKEKDFVVTTMDKKKASARPMFCDSTYDLALLYSADLARDGPEKTIALYTKGTGLELGDSVYYPVVIREESLDILQKNYPNYIQREHFLSSEKIVSGTIKEIGLYWNVQSMEHRSNGQLLNYGKYILRFPVIQGTSGSPVFVEKPEGVYLAGIVTMINPGRQSVGIEVADIDKRTISFGKEGMMSGPENIWNFLQKYTAIEQKPGTVGKE